MVGECLFIEKLELERAKSMFGGKYNFKVDLTHIEFEAHLQSIYGRIQELQRKDPKEEGVHME